MLNKKKTFIIGLFIYKVLLFCKIFNILKTLLSKIFILYVKYFDNFLIYYL